MINIIHRISIKSPAAEVYKALSTVKGVAGWWTQETEGDEVIGGKISFIFRSPTGELLGHMVMEIQDLNPGKNVRWRVVSGHDEWLGTHITFDLSEADGQTIILFAHRGWKEEVEFMAHCSMKWAVFLLSLRDYVETGKGSPSPYDLKIDNWN